MRWGEGANVHGRANAHFTPGKQLQNQLACTEIHLPGFSVTKIIKVIRTIKMLLFITN